MGVQRLGDVRGLNGIQTLVVRGFNRDLKTMSEGGLKRNLREQ